MLELTHGRTIDKRVDGQDSQKNSGPEASAHAVHRRLSWALAALNYWQLHTLRDGRQFVGVGFSERIRRGRTLVAGWIFRGGDPMNRSRATVSGS
jgi:hypothetical protein